VAEAIKAVKPVTDLELGVTGSDDQTKSMIADLGDVGKVMIARELDVQAKYVDEADHAANEIVHFRKPVPQPGGGFIEQDAVRKRGLRVGDSQKLRNTIATVQEIGPVARGLAEAIGDTQQKGADALADKADEVRKKAERVLRDDYGEF